MIRALGGDSRGIAAVEFALVAPAFFAFIFLSIEGSRMVWTHQVLQQAAFAAVRCRGLGECTDATAKTLAVTVARRSRVVVLPADVTSSTTTCNARASMARVQIQDPYAKSVGAILPAARAKLIATACFPIL